MGILERFSRKRSRAAGAGWGALLFMLLGWHSPAMLGCSQTPKRIFEEHHPPIVWPPPPARARIRYVGEIRSSADLKPSTGPFKAIGEFLFGADEPGSLYGPRDVLCVEGGKQV